MQVEPGFAADFARDEAPRRREYRATLGPYADVPGASPRRACRAMRSGCATSPFSNTTWGNRIFPVYGPRDAVHPVGAAIGPGLPLGIGAAMAGQGGPQDGRDGRRWRLRAEPARTLDGGAGARGALSPW